MFLRDDQIPANYRNPDAKRDGGKRYSSKPLNWPEPYTQTSLERSEFLSFESTHIL